MNTSNESRNERPSVYEMDFVLVLVTLNINPDLHSICLKRQRWKNFSVNHNINCTLIGSLKTLINMDSPIVIESESRLMGITRSLGIGDIFESMLRPNYGGRI